VKSVLRRVLYLTIIIVLMIGLAQTALASGTFRTTDTVRLRSGPSTEANVIRTVSEGSNVEVLEHDPAGWSKVRVGGAEGYIRSDFLKVTTGNSTITMKTTDGVNLRAEPSTEAEVLRTVSLGTNIEVIEHDPAGWSKVKVENTEGYIRSDFLVLQIRSTSQASAASAPSQTSAIFRTTDGVNLRSGPSTDADVLKTLVTGSIVNMLEHNPNGWSKVSANGTVGYIRSDFLRQGGGTVEYLDWADARPLIRTGVPIKIIDVRTGLTFNLQCFSRGKHADVEPPTAEDTEIISRTRNGVWAWDPRPVWVVLGDRTIAAALNGMPHAGSTISGNNMNGHLCLHFGGTITNSKSYQKNLREAVLEAWNAAQ